VSSVFGLISVPSQSAYNAAKFAVRGFTDALRMELEADGGRVSATTVHPGGIATNIAKNARMDPTMGDASGDFDKLLRTSPEDAAKTILTAVQRNRRRVLIGADARVIDLLPRLPQFLYQRALSTGFRQMRKREERAQRRSSGS
jgi:butyryl-CoA dehydrogenase